MTLDLSIGLGEFVLMTRIASILSPTGFPRARLRRDSVVEGLFGLVVVAFYARHFALRLGDPDFWGRLAVGQLILAHRTIPHTDPFSYLPTLPIWIDHEWLTGVVFYSLWNMTGDAGVLVLKTLLGLSTIVFAWLTARLNTPARWPLLIVLAASMPVFGYGVMPRAQTFTYFLFALWLYLLELHRHRKTNWPLAILPLSMVPWVNLHGGFLAGLGLLAIYVVSTIGFRREFFRLGLLWCVCCLATLINPYGLQYWHYLLPAVTMSRPNVAEWSAVPISLEYLQFWLLVGASTATILRIVCSNRIPFAPLLVLGVTLLISVRHARHMPLLAISACSFVPGVWFSLSGKTATRVERRWRVGDVVLVATLCGLIGSQLWGLFVIDGAARFVLPEQSTPIENMVVYPVKAVDFAVSAKVKGNLAVPFNWGEYALWRLYPRCRVALDGRYETVYPQQTVEMVEDFFAARTGWQSLLDQFHTTLVLAPYDAPINAKLAAAGWTSLFSDGTATLWSVPTSPKKIDKS